MKITLPHYLLTVTTLSKTIAAVLFITMPFAGFYLGTKYQGVGENTLIRQEVETTKGQRIIDISEPIVPEANVQPVYSNLIDYNVSPKGKYKGFKLRYPADFDLSLGNDSTPATGQEDSSKFDFIKLNKINVNNQLSIYRGIDLTKFECSLENAQWQEIRFDPDTGESWIRVVIPNTSTTQDGLLVQRICYSSNSNIEKYSNITPIGGIQINTSETNVDLVQNFDEIIQMISYDK